MVLKFSAVQKSLDSSLKRTHNSLVRRRMYHPSFERLEDRTVPSGVSVTTFAGNEQHTALFSNASQHLDSIHWSTPVDLTPPYTSSGELLIHYGAPLVTADNTVIVPVKTDGTDFRIEAHDGATGALKYTLDTDYTLSGLSYNWVPSFGPVLAPDGNGGQILAFAGAGGTIWYVDNPDAIHTDADRVHVAFYGLANYTANPSGFNSTVWVDTPITGDSQGNIYFGFRVQNTAPAPLTTTQSGYARIALNGAATYALAGNAAGDSNVFHDSHNLAPALSNDESTIYIGVKGSSRDYSYLLGLDSTTLATKYKVFLTDPRNGSAAGMPDDGTATPMVGPDGTVFFGVLLDNPYNGSRGAMLHFSADLTHEFTAGGFGWDNTAAIVPASMVPSYHGSSSYLLFTKYNNYAGGTDADGVNKIAVLDPYSTEVDPHASSNGLLIMREVLTVAGPTPDPANITSTTPHAVREWCINTAAVDPATDSVLAPSEDGNIYRWYLGNDSLSETINLGTGIGEAYVPTIIGPDGTVFTINNAKLFAVGNPNGVGVIISSSAPDNDSVVQGQALTFTATVTGSGSITPTGTVNFLDTVTDNTGTKTTTTLATVVLDGTGRAAFATSSLSAANHFITALYGGDANFNAASSTLVENVHSSATTSSITSSPNPVSFGQPVTFTATVTPATSGLGTPTGMVIFSEGTSVLWEATLNSSSQVTFTTSSLSPGFHTITARYHSDPVYASSQGDDSAMPQLVQDATSTALSSSVNPSVFGQRVTFTASVLAADANAGIPAGTVSFTDGVTTLASGITVDATGLASISTSALAVGSHTITASFTGNPGWLNSSGNDSGSPQVVNQDAASVAVGSSANSVVFGQAVTLTATVSAIAPGTGTPTGTVTYLDGTATLGTVTLDATGHATLSTSSLTVGSHSIQASYGGDSNFTSSISGVLSQTVNQAASATTISSSVNPAVFGQAMTFTATVSPIAPGVGVPTGTVTFLDGTATLGTATLSSGQATFSTSSLAVGSHSISAGYGSDANFTSSSSGVITQIVNRASTSTSVSASTNPSVSGQTIVFSASVSVLGPGFGAPTGTVTFLDDSTTLGTAALSSSGAASLSTNLLAGTHTITAVYGGDANFSSSTSPVVSQIVNKAGTSTTVVSSVNPSSNGQAVTFTATVSIAVPGSGVATGTVTFKDGSTVLGTSSLNASGKATLTTSSLSPGSHSITAVYNGDANFTGSTSTVLAQVVRRKKAVAVIVLPPIHSQAVENFVFSDWGRDFNLFGSDRMPSLSALEIAAIQEVADATAATRTHAATVFDDAAVDQLFDGTGLSWFFVHQPDDVINNNAGPSVPEDVVAFIRP
jgi:hypothetical protein